MHVFRLIWIYRMHLLVANSPIVPCKTKEEARKDKDCFGLCSSQNCCPLANCLSEYAGQSGGVGGDWKPQTKIKKLKEKSHVILWAHFARTCPATIFRKIDVLWVVEISILSCAYCVDDLDCRCNNAKKNRGDETNSASTYGFPNPNPCHLLWGRQITQSRKITIWKSKFDLFVGGNL